MDLKQRIDETWNAVNGLSWVDFETEIEQEKKAIIEELYDIYIDEADYDVDEGNFVFCGTPLGDIALRYTDNDDILQEITELLEAHHEQQYS